MPTDEEINAMDRGDALPGVDDVPLESELDADDVPPAELPVETPPAVEPPVETPPAVEPPAAAKPNIQIPKARLDEEIGKRRRVEQENEALKQRMAELEARTAAASAPTAPAAPVDPATVVGSQEWFDAQESAYMDAVLDGEGKQALQIRRQIREAEEAAYEARVSQRSRQVLKEVDIEQENARAIDQLEGAFAVFNPSAAEFDDDLVNAVLGARAAIMKRDPAKLPGAALIEAAAKLGYKLGVEPSPEPEPAAEPEDVVEPAPPAGVAQPPRGAGDSPQRPRVRLTEATLDKMSASDLARARGDIV